MGKLNQLWCLWLTLEPEVSSDLFYIVPLGQTLSLFNNCWLELSEKENMDLWVASPTKSKPWEGAQLKTFCAKMLKSLGSENHILESQTIWAVNNSLYSSHCLETPWRATVHV